MMKKVLIINEDEEEAKQFKIRKTIMHQFFHLKFTSFNDKKEDINFCYDKR